MVRQIMEVFRGQKVIEGARITSYNVCYTKLLRAGARLGSISTTTSTGALAATGRTGFAPSLESAGVPSFIDRGQSS